MTPLPWFRFYSEALHDRKLTRICRQTNQPKALVLGVWATVLALGNDSPQRGCLMISDDIWLTLEEIRAETGLDIVTFDSIMQGFTDLSMIHDASDDGHGYIVITNFHKRNFKSDDSTARVQKHRAKSEETPTSNDNETSEGNVTPPLPERSSNVLDPDPDPDPETNTESDPDPERLCGEPPQPPPKPPEPPPKIDKPPPIPMTPGLGYFLAAFGRKRFATIVQKRALADCESEVGPSTFISAIDWAARKGIRDVDAIITAARNWGKKKGRAPRAQPALAGVKALGKQEGWIHDT